MPIQDEDDDVSSESSDSSSDDDSLVLEGQMVRNPDVSSSSSDDDEEEEEEEKPAKSTPSKKSESTDKKRKQHPTAASSPEKNPTPTQKRKKKKKQRNDDDGGVDMSYVEFIFCDMHEKYWDGLKALISNAGSALYQAHSSALADQMIEYDMVGTVLAQDHDPEHNVYGFGSILHWGHFPTAARQQFATVCGGSPEVPSTITTSSSTSKDTVCQKRVAQALQAVPNSPVTAFLLMGRMINVPVEIVLTLHQQVWQDIVWAQKEKTKLSYKKIDKVLRLAPCTQDGSSYVYRYFEDELLAAQAVGSYVVEAPRSFSREDKVYLQVLELTLPAYERAIQALERMVNGSDNNHNTKK